MVIECFSTRRVDLGRGEAHTCQADPLDPCQQQNSMRSISKVPVNGLKLAFCCPKAIGFFSVLEILSHCRHGRKLFHKVGEVL